LTNAGCKVDGEINNFCGSVYFSYTSRKSKVSICKINMGIYGGTVKIQGNHFSNKKNILTELPENMLEIMKNGKKCSECTYKNHTDHTAGFKFTHKKEDFQICRWSGFTFPIDTTVDLKLIEKWIELELGNA
jgi:hypothetical protein